MGELSRKKLTSGPEDYPSATGVPKTTMQPNTQEFTYVK